MEEKKANKKKLLVRYLVLAACILVIAAITVISVFAANNWFKPTLSVEKPDDGQVNVPDDNPGGNKPDDNPDDGKPDDKPDDKPTDADTSWLTPVATVNVITPYDFTENVSLKNCWHFHAGLDLAADVGTAVVCCFDGTVESIVLDDQLDGNTVTVSHANGLKTVYSFLTPDENIKVGASVKRGELLGTVAEPTGSECSLAPHIHFEVVKNGVNDDPELYLDISEK